MESFKTIIESKDEKKIKNFLFYLNDYLSFIEELNSKCNECCSFYYLCEKYFETFNNIYNYIKDYLTDEIVENIVGNKLKLNNPILSSILVYYDRNIINKLLKNCKEICSIYEYNLYDLIKLLKVIFTNVDIELINKNIDDIHTSINVSKNNYDEKDKMIIIYTLKNYLNYYQIIQFIFLI